GDDEEVPLICPTCQCSKYRRRWLLATSIFGDSAINRRAFGLRGAWPASLASPEAASSHTRPCVFESARGPIPTVHGVVFDIFVWERDRRPYTSFLQTSFRGASPLNQA